VLARATTAGEAARGLPALHAACGACHQALGARDFDLAEAPRGHADASLALLEGLSGRAESLFTSAAGLSAQLAGQPDAATLGAFRKAAARAEVATTWVERTAATQELYALCGSCHAALEEP
jgi:cytochrome c556